MCPDGRETLQAVFFKRSNTQGYPMPSWVIYRKKKRDISSVPFLRKQDI